MRNKRRKHKENALGREYLPTDRSLDMGDLEAWDESDEAHEVWLKTREEPDVESYGKYIPPLWFQVRSRRKLR